MVLILSSLTGADSLLQRSMKGDSKVDAAIDAYASDHDVHKFLDTLQTLAVAPEAHFESSGQSSKLVIDSAKYDLLRHSLDVMIAQGQITEEGE
jgi:hypothetical protein